MAARVVTVAFQGVEARRVDVEVQQTPCGPLGGGIVIVGLGDKAVAESRERVRAAFSGLGLALPDKKIVVNLAPADLPKEGSHYDLPIPLLEIDALLAPSDAGIDLLAVMKSDCRFVARLNPSVGRMAA
jgi:magnesium chelatase family protein